MSRPVRGLLPLSKPELADLLAVGLDEVAIRDLDDILMTMKYMPMRAALLLMIRFIRHRQDKAGNGQASRIGPGSQNRA